MDFKYAIAKIEGSKEFQDFIRKDPHYYLVHVFTVKDSFNDRTWQIGYYSRDTDKIVVFEDHDDMIFIHPPAEALKKDEYIQKLSLDAVNISKDDAEKVCESVLKDYYPAELLSKAIFLLQNLPEFGQVWNVTMVTHAFGVINAKIDAHTGNVLKHHKENLMNWRA